MKASDGAVFVLGGGRIGLTAVKDLVASESVKRVTVGDIDTARAEKLARELRSEKLSVTKVDLTNRETLVKAIENFSILINAAWYEHNVEVMRAAIAAGVHYLDMGGLFHVTRRQMELDDRAKQARITAVLGAGESPGITNVMSAMSSHELDLVQDVRIRVGAHEKVNGESDKLVFPFAISTVFDEYSKPPIMFLNGKFQELQPLSGAEEVDFPAPVGRQTCHYSIHSEMATLPLNIKGVRNVDFKLGVSESIYQAIKPMLDIGMGSTEPIEVGGKKVSPRDLAIAMLTAQASDVEPQRYVAIRTEVTGTRKGKRVCQVRELIGEPSQSMGVNNATSLLTGIGASITAQLILSGSIREIGVLAPEICIPPSELTQELEKRGIKINKREIDLTPAKHIMRPM